MGKVRSGARRLATARLVMLTVVAAMAVVAAGDASAQQASGNLRAACAGDVKTLCPGIQPGGGRIAACFRQNRDKLSPGCKQALMAAKGTRKPPASGT